MYRVTKRAAQVRRFARDEVPDGEMRTDRHRRADGLRVEIVYRCYDTDPPTENVARLYDSGRIDSYFVEFDGARFPRRLGITRALDQVRKAKPRMLSERRMG